MNRHDGQHLTLSENVELAPEIRLVSRLPKSMRVGFLVFAVLAGLTVSVGVRAYSADYSDPSSWRQLASMTVWTLICGIGVLVYFLIPRTVVTVGHSGILAARCGRRIVVGWEDVQRVRAVDTRQNHPEIVFELSPRFWAESGAGQWIRHKVFRRSVVIAPAHMDIATAIDAVARCAPPTLSVSGPTFGDPWISRIVRTGFLAFLLGTLFATPPATALAIGGPFHQRPATIPGPPCQLISARILTTLVPAASDLFESEPSLYNETTAHCRLSFYDQPRNRFGSVIFDVTRYGSSRDRPSVDRAREEFVNKIGTSRRASTDKPGVPTKISGVGDDGFSMMDESGSVIIRRGTDIVEVSYSVTPSTLDLQLVGAISIARDVLTSLK